MNKELVPLKDIDDNLDIWRGSRFRIYGVGLNVESEEDDYYEYMIAEIPGERDYMLLTCVEGHKSGCALALVKASNENNAFRIKGGAIKYSMGIDKTFMIKE